nr:nero [Cucujiformia]
YCLGQMQDQKATHILMKILEDEKQESIVRHEAAEALGAIGSDDVLPHLEKYKNDPIPEVAETCQLALDRIKWLKNTNQDETKLPTSPYASVDPAPPSTNLNIDELESQLTNETLPLFERYRAMFALRNIGSPEAVKILGKALSCGGALFKHEVAFVLGQIQHKDSIPFLRKCLENIEENEMVRHECA